MAAQVISFHCTLKDRFGQLISQTTNRDVITQDPGQPVQLKGQLKGLTRALENLQPGEKRTVNLTAAEAYGFYNPKLSVTKLRCDIIGGDDLKTGETVKYLREGETGLYRVTASSSISVTLDANHPLAGQDLVFEIEAMEIREALPEDFFETVNETSLYHH